MMRGIGFLMLLCSYATCCGSGWAHSEEVSADSVTLTLEDKLGKARAESDTAAIIEVLTQLSYASMREGNFINAWKKLQEVERYLSKNNPSLMLRNKAAQSHALFVIGLFDEAIEMADSGIALARLNPSLDYKRHLLALYGNKLDSYVESRQLQKAHDFYRSLPEGVRDPGLNLSITEMYLALDSPAIALSLLDTMQVESNHRYNQFRKQNNFFESYAALGHQESARKAALLLVKNLKVPLPINARLVTYRKMEKAYLFLQNRDSAYHYYKLYFKTYQKIYNSTQISEILKDEFKKQLANEMEKSALQKNLLQSKLSLHEQRTYFFITATILLGIVIVLVLLRYRSERNFNSLLKQKVEERTLELSKRNKQLTEYAFINAHRLRAPVARILGLTTLASSGDPELELPEIVRLLKKESESLDSIVRSITQAIDENRVFDRHDLPS